MRKFVSDCCKRGVEDNFHFDNTYEPEKQSLLPTEPPAPQPDLSKEPNQVIRVRSHGGVIIAHNARFSANGGEHVVVIRFERYIEGGGAMSVAVDGNAYHLCTRRRRKLEGNAELQVDGVAVEFLWDLDKSPMEFLFRRKAGGNRSDICEGWRREEECYSVMILGETA